MYAFRRRAARIRRRLRPLQGLQGDHEAPAGAVDVAVYAGRRPRHQGQQQRQDQEVERSDRQEGLSPARCRSTPACISRTRWPRSASSTSTRRSTCRPWARSSTPAPSKPRSSTTPAASCRRRGSRRPRWRSTGPGSIPSADERRQAEGEGLRHRRGRRRQAQQEGHSRQEADAAARSTGASTSA